MVLAPAPKICRPISQHQIAIEPAAAGYSPFRDFVHCRFADAGRLPHRHVPKRRVHIPRERASPFLSMLSIPPADLMRRDEVLGTSLERGRWQAFKWCGSPLASRCLYWIAAILTTAPTLQGQFASFRQRHRRKCPKAHIASVASGSVAKDTGFCALAGHAHIHPPPSAYKPFVFR